MSFLKMLLLRVCLFHSTDNNASTMSRKYFIHCFNFSTTTFSIYLEKWLISIKLFHLTDVRVKPKHNALGKKLVCKAVYVNLLTGLHVSK